LIAVITPRSTSFKNPLEYLEFGRDGMQQGRAAWMEFHNLATRNTKLAACFMAATAAGSVSGTEKPVYHFSVSFDIDDPVDEVIMRRVAERTRRDMGLLEYECVVVAHQDRSHPHLHFLVNLVHPERGTLWRDWRDYYRLERSLRAQEVELGLRVVPGWNAPVPSLARERDGLASQPQNARWIKPRPGLRRGDDAFLRDVTVRAAHVLQRARSWADIERGLAEEGLTLRSKGGGFIITDGKHLVKASEVGRACSRYHLEKRLGRWPDYRARIAVAAMARTEPAVQPEPPARHLEAPAPAVDSLASTPQQDAPTPATSPVHEPNPQARARAGHRPQFGDAGYGIAELFGHTPAKQEVQAASVLNHASVEPVPEITTPAEPILPTARPRRRVDFLKDAKDRAAPVLQRADSWDELERGLAERGLSLRVSGGGFTITDGEMEVKASEVGRAFSRSHLEKRLGRWTDYRAGATVAAMPWTTPAAQPAPGARQQASPVPGLDSPTPSILASTVFAPADRPQAGTRPQFGDAGHGIAELFGHTAARQEVQGAPVLDHTAVEMHAKPVELHRDPWAEEPEPASGPPAQPTVLQQHLPTVQPTRAAEPVESIPSIERAPAVPIDLDASGADARLVESVDCVETDALPSAPDRLRRRVDFLVEVKDRAVPLLQRAGSWDELERGLAERGLSLRVSGGGFTITNGEMEVKASEVGRAFSRLHMEKRLGRYSVRDGGTDTLGTAATAITSPVQDVLAEPAATPVLPEEGKPPVAPPAADVDIPLAIVRPVSVDAATGPGGVPTLGSSGTTPSASPDRLDVSAEDIIKLPEPTVEPLPPVVPPASVREPVVPVRKKVRPPTRRDEYREVIAHFTRELKELYIRPSAARRAFAEEACMNGREEAVRLLTDNPKHYGRLWFFGKRLPHAVQWGTVYAEWQEERTRPSTRRAAALYRKNIEVEAADSAVRDAEGAVDKTAAEIKSIEKRFKRAADAERLVQEGAPEVYAKPKAAIMAINAYRRTNDLDEVVRAIREAPEQFGALRARKRSKVVKMVTKPDTSAARMRARTFAFEVRAAFQAIAVRPKRGDLERAQEAKREAVAAVEAARWVRIKLPSTPAEDYVQQAANVLRRAARGSVARAERIADQLATMLPAGAVKLARTAIKLARGPEQEGPQRGGRGL
jgi:hypothetical protein